MRVAAQEAVELNEGDRDITAIFDGSWQKRGHSSLNGMVRAISGDTGKVIDVTLKVLQCQNRLQQEHVNGCLANYQGGSGKMEVEGVLKMFQESEALHGVRYKFYLGDGDSSSFATVEKEHPYGPDFQVVKNVCVGHVQKRMGTRLRRRKWAKILCPTETQ